jgi:hypothetical protein
MPKKPATARGGTGGPVPVMDRKVESPIAAGVHPDALVNPEMVNVFHAAVSKPEAAAEGKGRCRSRTSATHRVFVQAWVRNVAYGKDVWMDTRLLDQAGKIVASEDLPLAYLEPAGGGGDFFLADTALPEPATRQPSNGARKLQFRLYYQVNGDVFTDGAIHEYELAS